MEYFEGEIGFYNIIYMLNVMRYLKLFESFKDTDHVKWLNNKLIEYLIFSYLVQIEAHVYRSGFAIIINGKDDKNIFSVLNGRAYKMQSTLGEIKGVLDPYMSEDAIVKITYTMRDQNPVWKAVLNYLVYDQEKSGVIK
jgi:hypothetical protein